MFLFHEPEKPPQALVHMTPLPRAGDENVTLCTLMASHCTRADVLEVFNEFISLQTKLHPDVV